MNARRQIASLLTAALAAAPALAGEPGASDWAGEPEGRARLISAETAAGADGRLQLGVEIRLAPGWHTYWRDPGESGAPPLFDWSGSGNLAQVELRWPAPRRFEAFGLTGHGWEEEVVFPVEARLADPGAPGRVRLRLDYQICDEICVPVAAELALDVPAGAARPTAFAPLLAKWRKRLPGADGLRLVDAELQGSPGEELLIVRAQAAAPFVAPELFVEAPRPWRFGGQSVELWGEDATFRVPVQASRRRPSLAGQEIVLTLVEGERAVERRIRLPAAP